LLVDILLQTLQATNKTHAAEVARLEAALKSAEEQKGATSNASEWMVKHDTLVVAHRSEVERLQAIIAQQTATLAAKEDTHNTAAVESTKEKVRLEVTLENALAEVDTLKKKLKEMDAATEQNEQVDAERSRAVEELQQAVAAKSQAVEDLQAQLEASQRDSKSAQNDLVALRAKLADAEAAAAAAASSAGAKAEDALHAAEMEAATKAAALEAAKLERDVILKELAEVKEKLAEETQQRNEFLSRFIGRGLMSENELSSTLSLLHSLVDDRNIEYVYYRLEQVYFLPITPLCWYLYFTD
jgi:DNA repair exonuclease SbcCD ATPase subunit